MRKFVFYSTIAALFFLVSGMVVLSNLPYENIQGIGAIIISLITFALVLSSFWIIGVCVFSFAVLSQTTSAKKNIWIIGMLFFNILLLPVVLYRYALNKSPFE